MTGILGKFHVEHGVHGARVLARFRQVRSVGEATTMRAAQKHAPAHRLRIGYFFFW